MAEVGWYERAGENNPARFCMKRSAPSGDRVMRLFKPLLDINVPLHSRLSVASPSSLNW
jgi:hypothetical protein